MKPSNHQERQNELEQAFQNVQTNATTINDNQDKIFSQSQLVEMAGLLFDTSQDETPATPSMPQEQQYTAMPLETQTTGMPQDLQQAQQEVQQAHETLLNENQQLQQALYQLHQQQETVKQIQSRVQQAQQEVQVKQATANAIVNSLK
ncbi:hypothetical protein H1D32_12380 [Anaerobacillus sp. CMMVII]|uniref:hypothetical protein n=1 Tax=Anaerobacillus sp. CMMVII TaxID=2755588 RepID=UPI0021B7E2CB|nr:hypothetical protein [Anaerobacillus sp. CMMVII]MCT8138467.1 hypothetical protein [Anaerobacillus sp. CMMVII]